MNSKLVRLSECCKFKPPKSEARKLLSAEDLVSFVPMKNLGIDTPHVELDQNKKLSEVSGSYTYFANNDVLLAKITPCFENGKLGIAEGLTNGIGFGSSEFIVFRPLDMLQAKYLYYYLSRSSFRKQGQSVMTGAVGHKRVPKEFIEDTLIPLPSITIQKQIVAKLDAAFADIDKAKQNAEKNLNNTRELFDSYLQNVFDQKGVGWTDAKLGDLAEFKNGLNFSKSSKGEMINVVGVKDFAGNFSVPYNQLDVIRLDGELDEAYELKCGDVLTVRSNGNKRLIGRCLLVEESEEKVSYSGFTIRIRLNSSDVIPRFLMWHLKSPGTHELLIGAGGGANISNLNQKILSSLPLSFPDKSSQESIVSVIESIRKEIMQLESIYKRKIEALDELKQSILQKAFSGEL